MITDSQMAYMVDSWQYTMDDRGRAFVNNGHFHQWSGMSVQVMARARTALCAPVRQPGQRRVCGDLFQPRVGRVSTSAGDRASHDRCRQLPEGQPPTLDVWPDDVNRTVVNNGEGYSNPQHFFLELQHLLPPSIRGVSLKAKQWGEFLVDNLSTIRWSSAAFDHLVIPETHRKVV